MQIFIPCRPEWQHDYDAQEEACWHNFSTIPCLECHIETDMAGQIKRKACIRTEPHQGSWVNSPIYKARQVREIGKIDE